MIFFLRIRRPPRSTQSRSSAASDVYKRQGLARTEKPHMDLDLRSRLDSKGRRHGKVLDYAVSESRVMDVLENICVNMQDYAITTDGTTKQVIKLNNNNEPVSITGNIGDVGDKSLKPKCEALLEEYEEEITGQIQRADVKDLEDNICIQISQSCPGKPKSEL
eukprot:TRINITY_DN28424_c0_g1_i1.p1 TRINITY_DN28424_c0_g1~~TRINITY_DN28424_c0_g1_i1.p1  ORF type:complete len:163 (+),score=47.87 TRINITY_DN28424_c0_g1_i1:38-526(+)